MRHLNKLLAILVIVGLSCAPIAVQAFVTGSSTPSIEYVVDASETDQGSTGNGKSIKAYVDAIGITKKATIVLTHSSTGNTTPYTLTTDETISSNFNFKIENGAILDGAGTLTINCPFKAGLYQCFGSSVTVVFGTGAIKEAYPQWWGAYSDGTNADVTYDAIQAALDSLETAVKGKVNFTSGTYSIDDTLTMHSGLTLDCSSRRSASITTALDIPILTSDPLSYLSLVTINNLQFANTYPVTATAGSIEFHIELFNCLIVHINNVHVYSNFADTDYNTNNRGGISITATLSGSNMNVIENCLIQNGSILLETSDSKIKSSWIWGHTCAYGIKLNNGNIEVVDCDITGPEENGAIWLTSLAVSSRINNNFFDGAAVTDATSGDAIYGISGTGAVINGNTFWGYKRRGIYMQDCDNFSVTGNHFVDNNNADDSHPDIELKGVADAPHMNTFSGNTFLQNSSKTNKGEAYKEVDGGNTPINNTFSGNTISDNYAAVPVLLVATFADKTKTVGNVGAVVTENLLSFSPTLENITIGNGTVAAFYAVTGHAITYTCKISLGTTSTVDGMIIVSLPTYSKYDCFGNAWAYDGGTLLTGVATVMPSAGVVYLNSNNGAYWNTTVPVTWAVNDVIAFSITYIRIW